MTALSELVFPLLPANAGQRGTVVAAPADWSLDIDDMAGSADVVVWGRLPGSETGSSPARALAREKAVLALRRRPPAGMRVASVHRLAPRRLRTGRARDLLRGALAGSVLIELTSLDPGARILDAVMAAAGVQSVGTGFHAGAGGSLLIKGILAGREEVVVRVARAGAPGDPAGLVDMLGRLQSSGVALAPTLRGHGCTAGASWLVESALPGRRPARLDARLGREVARFCALLPRSGTPPDALAADLAAVAVLLPDRAGAAKRLSDQLATVSVGIPAVMRHGDLWTGNLLAARGRLSGIIDWDAAHPAGVPGADLVQVFGTDARRRAGLSLGAGYLTRPWRSKAFGSLSTDYWRALGLRADEALLELAATAWWAAEIHGTLARLPHRAGDEEWLATNVDPVLRALLA